MTVGVRAQQQGRPTPAARRPAPPASRPAPKNASGRRESLASLEAASRGIQDPVAKLRYIRGSLAKYQRIDRVLRVVPFAPLRHALYRFSRLDGLGHVLSQNPMGGGLAAQDDPRRARRIVGTAALGVVVILAAGLTAAAYRGAKTPPPGPGGAGRSLPAMAEPLPDQPKGMLPAAVWLVEKGPGWEQYSNGLRIDTSYEVAGEPRRYRVFDAKAGMSAETFDKPVGILFHTSESDIWPLDEAHNEKLRDSSQALLRYLKRNDVYHYLVDRFGRVFRVVAEESKANHAGHSVWSRGDVVHLNLNNAFLGLSFETRWEGGKALPITAAQLSAGRNLTDYLRARWDIAPDMCVGHGIVSVSAKKHLIGHHLDWSRGFPFEAFGLPNQYARPLPAVELFGFGYDEPFLITLGEPWAGVREAERLLDREAAEKRVPIEQVRAERQQLFDQWLGEQNRDQEKAAPRPAPVKTASLRREPGMASRNGKRPGS